MATTDLQVTGVLSATGWTGATVANLSSSNDTRATDGVASELISVDIDNVPGDFGGQTSVSITVEARTQGTVSRAKQLQIELLNSSDTQLQTFTTGDLTGTDATYTTTVWNRSDSSTVIDGYRVRVTVQESGGMSDTATVEIDHIYATLVYFSEYVYTVSNTPITFGGSATTASETIETVGLKTLSLTQLASAIVQEYTYTVDNTPITFSGAATTDAETIETIDLGALLLNGLAINLQEDIPIDLATLTLTPQNVLVVNQFIWTVVSTPITFSGDATVVFEDLAGNSFWYQTVGDRRLSIGASSNILYEKIYNPSGGFNLRGAAYRQVKILTPPV